MTAPPLELKLLGAPRLVGAGGEPVPLALRRGIGLLAYLALQERPVPRDHLALLLWPEAEADLGRTRLRRLIYNIEDQCGADLFEASDGSCACRPARCAATTSRSAGGRRSS